MAVESGTYSPEVIARRQKIADQLLLQATKPREIRSRLQGLGQLGESALAGYEGYRADQDEKTARKEALAGALRAYGVGEGTPISALGPTAAPTAEGPPTVAPTAGSGFALPPTERTYAENELNPIDAKVATPPELAAGLNMSPKDMNIAARTVIGEAGGYKPRDKQAVAAVLLNRARMAGTSPATEALKPNQFEPWNTDAGRSRMMGPSPESPAYQDAARSVFMASQADPTGGATHFYSPTAQASLGRRPPNWDTGDGTDIGPHRFFNKPYGGVAAALSAPAASAFADAGPPQSQAAAPPPWQLADRFNAAYGNSAPDQQASLPPPQAAAPPVSAPPPPPAAVPAVAAALSAPAQGAPQPVGAGNLEAKIRAAMNPWTPPGVAAGLLAQVNPHPQAMKITNRDGSESIVFVDPNRGTITGSDGKPISGGAVGGGMSHPEMSGEEFAANLQKTDPGRANLIDRMHKGEVAPAQLGRYGNKAVQSLIEDATRIHPDFSALKWEGAVKAQRGLSSASPTELGGRLQALNNSIDHLLNTSDAAIKLGNVDAGNVMLSSPINRVLSTTTHNQDLINTINRESEIYGGERTKFLTGRGGSKEERLGFRNEIGAGSSAKPAMAGTIEGEITQLEDAVKNQEQQLRDSAGEGFLKSHPIVAKEVAAKIDRIKENIKILRGEKEQAKGAVEPAAAGGSLPPGWSVKAH